MTGQELGDDMGYGPARLHSPAETKDFSRFLDTQDLANLQARISRREFSPLYPAIAKQPIKTNIVTNLKTLEFNRDRSIGPH
jgi:hypothetical protein